MEESLKKCCEIDTTTKKLWYWSDKIEKIGKIILIVLIIFSVLNTIFSGVTTYQEIDAYASDDEATLGTFLAVLTSLFTSFIASFVTYCAYNIFSLILKAFGDIVLNTKISANISFKKEIEENN